MKKTLVVDCIAVRQASLNDLPQLKQLGIISYGQYAEALGHKNWMLMKQHLDTDEMLINLLNISTCFIATQSNNIIGMAFLVGSGNPNDVYRAEWCAIRLVAVHPDHERKGIAKMLTRLCIQHGISTGEKTIALHTSTMMPAAMHIYESFGFKQVADLGKRYDQHYFLYTLDISSKTSVP